MPADTANDSNADDDTMNYDAGNIVYLFAGGDEIDDIDGISDPYATVMVMPNDGATAYVYETLVAPGDYKIAFTCQGDNDEPDVDDNDEGVTAVVFHPASGVPITIVEGGTTTVDFPVPNI